jgi:hypothetical protein
MRMTSRRAIGIGAVIMVTLAACSGDASTTTWANAPTTAATTDTTLTLPTTSTNDPTPTSTSTTIAEEPAFLALETPLDGQIVVKRTLTVRGAATPDSTVRIGGAETKTPDDPGEIYQLDGVDVSSFELLIDLEEGENLIEVKADAETTSQTTVTLTVTYLAEATEEFAYLKHVAEDELVADYAQFLTGEEADEAAVDAGFIEPGEHVPNDYYIVNENPRLRTLPISVEALIILPTFESGPITDVRVDIDEWLSMFDNGEPWPENQVPANDRFFAPGAPWTPYWLTVAANGVVVQIRQQYLP